MPVYSVYADLNKIVPGLVIVRKYPDSFFRPRVSNFFEVNLTGKELMTIFDLSHPDLNDIIRPFRPLHLKPNDTVDITLEKLLKRKFHVIGLSTDHVIWNNSHLDFITMDQIA